MGTDIEIRDNYRTQKTQDLELANTNVDALFNYLLFLYLLSCLWCVYLASTPEGLQRGSWDDANVLRGTENLIMITLSSFGFRKKTVPSHLGGMNAGRLWLWYSISCRAETALILCTARATHKQPRDFAAHVTLQNVLTRSSETDNRPCGVVTCIWDCEQRSLY